MARATQRRNVRPGVVRRRRSWARHHGDFSLSAGIPSGNDILTDWRNEMGITAGPPGLTIGGGWLTWAYQVDPAVTIGAGTFNITAGLIVADEAMTSEVPGPRDQPHVDWLWWQTAYVTENRPEVIFDGSQSPMLRFRAQRRMDEVGMNLYLVFEGVLAGTVEFDVSTVVINP